METEIVYKIKQKDFEKILSAQLTKIQKESILARFRDRFITVGTVAEIHGVHRDTVIKYCNAKLIEHTREGKLYKFSLAAALEFDFTQLRRIS